MKDTAIKGSGNSLSIKVPPGTSAKYDSITAMLQDMEAGNFPIDLGPLNAAGCDVIGTLLNKANLLPDSVEQAIWGSAANRTPAQALQQLRSLITTAQTAADGKCKIATGSYVGTGLYGADNPTSITVPFVPAIVMLPTYSYGVDYDTRWLVPVEELSTTYSSGKGFFVNNNSHFWGYGKKSSDGRTLYWYAETNLDNWKAQTARSQFNMSDFTYRWLAIG